MKEVLRLEYDAGAGGLLATVSVVKESEHVPGVFVRQVGPGVPEPTASVALEELSPKAQEAFRLLLDELIPLVEKKHAAAVADPAEIAAAAARMAAAEYDWLRQKQAREEELARLGAEIEQRSGALDALKR